MPRKMLQTLILLTILCLLVPSSVSTRNPSRWCPSFLENPHSTKSPTVSVYSSNIRQNQHHIPIKIVNNSDFTTQAAVENWPGDGSHLNPYIIKGLMITGPFTEDNLIEIYDTDVYFQISSCFLNYGNIGISLQQVANGHLYNNTLSDFSYSGLYLQNSGNCTIENNTVVNSVDGLSIYSCFDILIQSNHISNNLEAGIVSSDLDKCTILSNNITNNKWGIQIDHFGGVTIVDNTIKDNQYTGIEVYLNDIIIRQWNGHEYRLIPIGRTWMEAKIDCEARGGHLVTITSQEENIIVASLAQHSIWIGLTDEATEGTWQWVTGEAVTYTNWNYGEPNDAGGREDYTELFGDGAWNDLSESDTLYYVCEWDTIDAPIQTYTTSVSRNLVINNSNGISCSHIYDIQISENIMINNSQWGLEIRDSSACNITQNQVIEGGIRFWASGYNRIINNSVFGHGFVIDGYDSTHYEQIYVINNSVNRKPLIYWQNVLDQIVPEAGQIILRNCENVTITNQNLSHTSDGVTGYYCTEITITNNTLNNNSDRAVWFQDSADCVISNNEMKFNDGAIEIDGVRNFTITNNTITNNFWRGIHLDGSTQNTLTNNTLTNNGGEGIRLSHSEDSVLVNNTVTHTGETGIYLYRSDNSILANNTIAHGGRVGIHLYNTQNSVLANNTVTSNSDLGIYLENSGNNVIRDNTLVNNSFSITGWEPGYYIQAEMLNNSINGKPIVYWQDVTGGTVPSGAELIILVDCSSVTVMNQHVVGIIGVYSENLTIQTNVIANGTYGILLMESYESYLSNNIVTNTRGTAIHLEISRAILTNNTLFNNNEGIKLWDSGNSFFFNNTVTSNVWNGINLENSWNCILNSNTVSNNGGTGIRLWDSGNSYLINNSIENNSELGIHLDNSGNNVIRDNILMNNTFTITGWDLGNYFQAEMVNNSIDSKPIVYWQHATEGTVPSGAGLVLLVASSSVRVMNQHVVGIIGAYCWQLMIQNNVISNGTHGIQLKWSFESVISDNLVTNTRGEGIHLEGSGNSLLTNNTVTNNDGWGINIHDSEYCTLTSNKVTNNSDGIGLGYSGSSLLTSNTVTDNFWEGINLDVSGNCILNSNTVSNNGGTGIRLWDSGNSTLVNNTVSHNSEKGISLRNSHNNSLRENWIASNGETGILIGDYGWWWYYPYIESSDNCVLVNNTILNNGEHGVKLTVSNYCVLMTNTITTNNESGILLENSGECKLFCNTITNNSETGIQLEDSSVNNTLSGNTIINNSYYGICIPSGENNMIHYNNLYGNNIGGSSQAYDNGLSNFFNHNFWDEWISPDIDENDIVDQEYSIEGMGKNSDRSPYVKQNHLIFGWLVNPRVGETLTGVVTIQWLTADILEHDVTYSVHYSIDGGVKWILLETGLTTSFYIWDTTTVADGSQYLLRITGNCSEGAWCVFSSDIAIDNLHHFQQYTILSPVGGEVIFGKFNIQWAPAQDVFNHDVTYTVSYSGDGLSWIILASNLTTTSYIWDTTTVPDGTRYIIQVTATCSEGSWQVASSHQGMWSITIANEWNKFIPPPIRFNPPHTLPNLMIFHLLGVGCVLFFVITLVIVVRRLQLN